MENAVSKKIAFSFRVRIRGKSGPSGGKTLSGDIPEFSLEEFRKTPNADVFVRKAYFAAVRTIMREIDQGTSGTVPDDLQSIESVVARSLKFTKDEIREWVQSRDWTRVKDNKDVPALVKRMEELLPELAARRNIFDEEASRQVADKVIAAVCDEQDPVAEFLFTTLTTVRDNPSKGDLGF